MSEAKKYEVWKPEETDRRYTEARIRRSDVQNQPCLRGFAEWLSNVRGLKPSTITVRIHSAGVFVDTVTQRLGSSCPSSFRILTADGVEDFFIEYGKAHGKALRNMQAAMRLFLRFAADRGWVGEDVVGSVPSLVSWRLSGLPRHLSDEELARLLEPPLQRRGECPCRDWAVVCLLATYGVRCGQVSALRLEDLDWQKRVIEFASHKGWQGRSPQLDGRSG